MIASAAPLPIAQRTERFDALLRETARYPLLASCTPVNSVSEQHRVEERWRGGAPCSPAWERPPIERGAIAELRRRLGLAQGSARESARAGERESGRAHDRGWLAVYADRLEEASAELAVIERGFSPSFAAAARVRFVVRDDEAAQADRIADEWLADREQEPPDEEVTTDDEADPRSLVAQMRRAVHAARVGVRVVVRDRIGALAAAGDRVVVVARARRIGTRESARVVLHELEGHVLPRERGRALSPSLCALGSAGASEDEEGRSLVLEARTGALGPARRRTLAARHLAATLVDCGATFVEVVRALLGRAVGLEDALAIVTRVMRGGRRVGSDVVGGLARERVYLPAWLRVTRAIDRGETTLLRLGGARLSLAARAAVALDVDLRRSSPTACVEPAVPPI